MGEPRGEGAQRQQLLALIDDLEGLHAADLVALEQVHRHRELGLDEPTERLGVEHEESRRTRHADRRLVEVVLVGVERAPRPAVHAALRRPVGHDVVPAGALGHHQFTVDQHVEARRRLTLDADGTRFVGGDVAVFAQRRQLLVAQLFEKEQRPELVGKALVAHHRSSQASAKYRCTNITAIDPSPTAAATRLADSARTSPATNTPGTLVSKWCGGRSSVQPLTSLRSGPDRMNPWSSFATTSSQSVRGSAPMKQHSRSHSTVSFAPLCLSNSTRPVRWSSSPSVSTTSVQVRTVMLSFFSICLIR